MHYTNDEAELEPETIYDDRIERDTSELGWTFRQRRDAIECCLPAGQRLPRRILKKCFLEEFVAGLLLYPDIADALLSVLRERGASRG